MTAEDVIARLESAVSEYAARYGLRKMWSEMHDIDPTYTNQVIKGVRRPSDKILAALGLVRVTTEVIESRDPNGVETGARGRTLLLKKIDDAVWRHGSRHAWAEHLGVSDTYVHMVHSGTKPPSKKILDDLGLSLVREERIEEKTQ